MINHNTLLYDLLDLTLKVTFQEKEWIANYTEGDLSELNKKLLDSDTKYPIIWLQSGYRVQRNKTISQTKIETCKIFFITLGSKSDRYEKRYETTYQEMLYSLVKSFDETIRKTKGITADNTDNFTTFPYNITNEMKGGQELTITDTWDALLLETGLTISDGCYPQYLIK